MEEDYDQPPGIGVASMVTPPPVPVNVNMSGDEAYQRRLALSQGFRPPEPSISSVTMSISAATVSTSSYDPPEDDQGSGIPGLGTMPTRSPPPPAPAPVAAVPVALTGEEAYLRRLAMSQQGAQPPRAPSPLPFDDSPPVDTPAVPPPMAPPPPVFAPTQTSALTADKIQKGKQAAAAIAARLAALAPKAGSPPAPTAAPALSSAPSEEPFEPANKKYVL